MGRLYNVAVLGATGTVGETIISILEERKFPVKKLYPLASSKSAGELISFRNNSVEVLDADKFDFSSVDIALFSAGRDVSAKYAPIAADAGCVVIDNTSCFRDEDDIPLIIPEINPDRIADYYKHNIIANPNCSTIQMLVALKPIYDAVGIDRINVSTYQSVSGSGREAVEELIEQTSRLLNGTEAISKVYKKQIAFNVLPHIDELMDNGYTKEEMKMFWETQKILEDSNIMVNATAVRVPVCYGHGEAIHIETKRSISPEEIRDLYYNLSEITLLDDLEQNQYPTPIEHGSGTDSVFVGRIRKDLSHPNGINLWVVADNVRKGAALNAVQIAEILIMKYLH